MHVYPRFIVDAEQGWAKDAQPAPGPSRAFPPDRPPTESYEIYPRFHLVPFHFDHPVTGRPPQYPEGTTVPVRPPAGKPVDRPGAAGVKTAAALASLIAATELSVNRSKAYHASENLATAYGYYIDEFAWDETADIFSRDGWKELSYVGTYVGRERIRQSLKLRYPNGKPTDFLTLHQIVQPVIHVSVDGRSAKIRVRPFQLGSRAGGEGSWLSGIYENTAVDEGGTWKLSGMDLESRRHYVDYSRAKDEMFKRTDIPEARWHVVESDNKRNARINCISHLLSSIPYEQSDQEAVELPKVQKDPDYVRPPEDLYAYVPDVAAKLIEEERS